MIPRIEFGTHLRGMFGIANYRVEVDYGVESSTRSNPLIHCLPDIFTLFRSNPNAFFWSQCGANYLDSMSMRTLNELNVRTYQVIACQIITRG